MFEIGDKVKLINNTSMSAEIGSLAIVTGFASVDKTLDCIKVKWLDISITHGQMNGSYEKWKFKNITTNRQLLFDFMEGT